MYWHERLVMWLAWRLPRRLAYWCAIRVIAHATTGVYSKTNPRDLGAMEVLDRWSADYSGSWNRSWWLNRDRLTVNIGYYPMWRGFRLALIDNGGRDADECLDLNAQIGRVHLGLTLWGIGRLSWLTRYIPRGPQSRGYTLGWLPGNE